MLDKRGTAQRNSREPRSKRSLSCRIFSRPRYTHNPGREGSENNSGKAGNSGRGYTLTLASASALASASMSDGAPLVAGGEPGKLKESSTVGFEATEDDPPKIDPSLRTILVNRPGCLGSGSDGGFCRRGVEAEPDPEFCNAGDPPPGDIILFLAPDAAKGFAGVCVARGLSDLRLRCLGYDFESSVGAVCVLGESPVGLMPSCLLIKCARNASIPGFTGLDGSNGFLTLFEARDGTGGGRESKAGLAPGIAARILP